MLKKFNWLHMECFGVCFGFSFLVEALGWTTQGKAFFWIVLGLAFVALLVSFISIIFCGASTGTLSRSLKKAFRLLLIIVGVFAILLAVTWGATMLFNVDFYVAFQLLGLGITLASVCRQ